MQALDGHAHGLAGLEKFMIEIGPDRTAQGGIAEEPGRDWRQIAVALFAHALRSLVEKEEFVFEGGARLEAQLFGLGQDTAQQTARAKGLGPVGKLQEEEQSLFLEGELTAGLRQNQRGRLARRQKRDRKYEMVWRRVGDNAHDISQLQ